MMKTEMWLHREVSKKKAWDQCGSISSKVTVAKASDFLEYQFHSAYLYHHEQHLSFKGHTKVALQ